MKMSIKFEIKGNYGIMYSIKQHKIGEKVIWSFSNKNNEGLTKDTLEELIEFLKETDRI